MKRFIALISIYLGSIGGVSLASAAEIAGDGGGRTANQLDPCRNSGDAIGPWSMGCIRVTSAVRVKYASPRMVRLPRGETSAVSEVVEYTVTAERPFPARGLDPVLTIGDHLIEDYRYLQGNVLVFTDYNPSAAPEGFNVVFQWGTKMPSGQAYTTSFKYAAARLPLEKQ